MTPLRCDGCWREDDVSGAWLRLETFLGRYENGIIRLCPSCAERFEAFLKSLREEPL